MDGSAATSFAERTRSQISRAFANRSTNDACAQSELFEQLLNLKFTVQPPPEKQPTTPDATPQSSSAVADKKESAKPDEDKDDQPSVTLATLNQAAPLIAEKPVELKVEQPAVATKADDATLKPTELVANQIKEQPTLAIVDPGGNSPSSANPADQVVVADTQSTDSKVDSTNNVTSVTPVDTHTTRKPIGESNSNKVDPVVTKVDDGSINQPHEIADTSENEPTESSATNAQQEVTVEPKPANGQNEEHDDRRGDRREKWFEHKDEAISASSFERSEDADSSNTLPVDPEAIKPQSTDSSLQTLAAAVPTTVAPAPDPTLTAPVSLPATLSVAPQTNNASASPAASTSGSTAEPNTSVASAPSRTVGNQTAKANSKEKVTEPGLSQQERVRVIQRIARSFNRISAEGGSINLRLHPEHLGSVSVQVRLEGRSLSARMSTETTAARDAIMQDLPALRQRLADQGFDVTKFQVDVAGNGADASFTQTGGQSQFSQSEGHSSGAQTDYRRVAAVRESRAAATRQVAPVTNPNWQSSAGIDLQA